MLKKNLISKNELALVYEEAKTGEKETEILFEERGVSPVDLLAAKSEALGVPSKTIDERKIPYGVLKNIPEETARHYKIAPLDLKDGVLEVGMVDPDNIEAREALQFITYKSSLAFKIFVISLSDLNKILEGYKGLGGEVSKALGELESAFETSPEIEKQVFKGEVALTEEAPVTKMVAVIIRHAIEGNASDIHIEPMADKLRVRFRVDGILYTSLILPLHVHEAVLSRIKILTNMQLDEKRKPQDGRFSARIENRSVDFRVSTFPTYFGEKAAIRILDPQQKIGALSDLGLSGRNLAMVEEALKKPYGLIFLVGPTGSGKTSTLYSMLQILNQERFNIVSLEDPIEYNIEGVNQSQVKPEIGYTFANGLRSILRQDPDTIMVGEVRDKETAQLAVHAALTGHLVLSTLHTNSAVGAVPRLVDMGVDPYLIAPTLIMAVGQRLVRTLCDDSKKELEVKGSLKTRLEEELANVPPSIKEKIKMPAKIYQAMPSSTCLKGTRGRIGVFEVLLMNKEIENIILTNPAEEAILKAGRKEGMVTMREDGVLKVLEGRVGLEELEEVI